MRKASLDTLPPPSGLLRAHHLRGGGAVVFMPVSSRQAAVPRLREVILAYRAEHTTLEQRASKLLARLQQSDVAAKAFKRLMHGAAAFERILQKGPPFPSDVVISPPRCNYTKEQKAAEILTICIEADGVARDFPLWIAKAETTLERAKRLDKAAAKLRSLVAKFDEQKVQVPSSVLGLSIFDPSADIAALKHALNSFTRRIDLSRGAAEATIAQLGATRKRRSKEKPAHNAAIWCLGAQIRTVVGRPRWKEIAGLANVILETDKVSWLRVRGVVRKGGKLYVEMIGRQTQRHLQEKIAEARRRQ